MPRGPQRSLADRRLGTVMVNGISWSCRTKRHQNCYSLACVCPCGHVQGERTTGGQVKMHLEEGRC